MRKYPFKNVHDVKQLAHKAFAKVTPEMVRNCYDHVEEQEIWYRNLHKLEPLPVEEIEAINETPEPARPAEEEALIFDHNGVVLTQDEEIEVIDAPVEVEPFACTMCDYKSGHKVTLKQTLQCPFTSLLSF